MPRGIEDFTEAFQNEAGTSCYLIIRPDNAEKFYNERGLLSRLNAYLGQSYQLYQVNLNENPAIRLLTKSEVRKIHQSLKKAKKIRRQLLELESIINLPE